MLHDSKYRIIFAVANIQNRIIDTPFDFYSEVPVRLYRIIGSVCLPKQEGASLLFDTYTYIINLFRTWQTRTNVLTRSTVVSIQFLSTARRKTAQSTSTTQLRQSMPRKQSAVPSMRAASITSAYLSIWNPLS